MNKLNPLKAKSVRTTLFLCTLSCAVPAFVPLITRAIAQQPTKPDMTFTDANNGETVEASVGNIFEVILESNATTGYSWNIATQDAKILESLGDPKYVRPAGAPPGAPGQQVFQFKVKGAGETKLVLHYNRPWEKDKEPAKLFSLGLKNPEKK